MTRFLKVTFKVVFGADSITREDLARVKDGSYEAIIDTQNGTYFDSENNTWAEIK